jgi:hypothetical protein
MLKRTRKQTQDINQFGADVTLRSMGTELPQLNQSVISQIMAAMKCRDGLKGDAVTVHARLSLVQRKASVRRAAQARWVKTGKPGQK